MPALPKCSTCGTKAKYYGEFPTGGECEACFYEKEREAQKELFNEK